MGQIPFNEKLSGVGKPLCDDLIYLRFIDRKWSHISVPSSFYYYAMDNSIHLRHCYKVRNENLLVKALAFRSHLNQQFRRSKAFAVQFRHSVAFGHEVFHAHGVN